MSHQCSCIIYLARTHLKLTTFNHVFSSIFQLSFKCDLQICVLALKLIELAVKQGMFFSLVSLSSMAKERKTSQFSFTTIFQLPDIVTFFSSATVTYIMLPFYPTYNVLAFLLARAKMVGTLATHHQAPGCLHGKPNQGFVKVSF